MFWIRTRIVDISSTGDFTIKAEAEGCKKIVLCCARLANEDKLKLFTNSNTAATLVYKLEPLYIMKYELFSKLHPFRLGMANP